MDWLLVGSMRPGKLTTETLKKDKVITIVIHRVSTKAHTCTMTGKRLLTFSC
jgi:hypothetical protein